MATITFHCPKCKSLCAFSGRFAGRQCRCLKCGQFMLVPTEDGGKPEKLEISCDTGQPLPGFYKAVFIDSWKVFLRFKSLTLLIFIAAVICAKFFFGHLNFFLEIGGQKVFAFYFGTLTKFLVWGSLFFCYMEIICSTAYDMEELPEIYMGGIFGFLWTIAKSAYTFLIALLIVELPCIIAIGIFKAVGIELRDRKSTRLNSSHIPYLVCRLLLEKKKNKKTTRN